MKHILLTQNQLALVDNEDYDWLNQWKWYAQWNRGTESFYAARHSKQIKGKRTTIQMHRLILNLLDGVDGDHINGITLDNQRHNLRPDPEGRNTQNQKTPRNNTSGYKGVSWDKRARKWKTMVTFKNKKYYAGLFDIKEDAARAYNNKALELHGEFARLNIVL